MFDLSRLFVCRTILAGEQGVRAEDIGHAYSSASAHIVIIGHLHAPTRKRPVRYMLEVEDASEASVGVVFAQPYVLRASRSVERRLIAAAVPVAGRLARGDYLAIITVEDELQERVRFKIQ